jgi:MOSC domain-containing protein YiiM
VSLPAGSPLAALLDAPVRPGRLAWIGLRPARRAPMVAVESAELRPGEGLLGDRWRGGAAGARQVTLVAAEHLVAIAGFLGLEAVAPARLRRNLVVAGVNLLALKGRRFRLGAALLEHSGECHPCSRMEQEFGPGGYNAVRGHGGITARVIEAGAIRLGDALIREG